MPGSTLSQLDDRHHDMAAAQSKPELENIRWAVNPNDIGWMFWEPKMEKNLGRSGKVFWKLANLKSGAKSQ